MLELTYKGSVVITGEDETSFTDLLADLEIGGSGSVRVMEPSSTQGNTADGATDDSGESCNDDAGGVATPATSRKSKKHKCDICGQVLNTRTGLRMHLAAHKGLKHFTCDICGKGIDDCQVKTPEWPANDAPSLVSQVSRRAASSRPTSECTLGRSRTSVKCATRASPTQAPCQTIAICTHQTSRTSATSASNRSHSAKVSAGNTSQSSEMATENPLIPFKVLRNPFRNGLNP